MSTTRAHATAGESIRRYVFRHSAVLVTDRESDRASDARLGYVQRADHTEQVAVTQGTIAALEKASAWQDTVPPAATPLWVRDSPAP